jgi:hypothetical protein
MANLQDALNSNPGTTIERIWTGPGLLCYAFCAGSGAVRAVVHCITPCPDAAWHKEARRLLDGLDDIEHPAREGMSRRKSVLNRKTKKLLVVVQLLPKQKTKKQEQTQEGGSRYACVPDCGEQGNQGDQGNQGEQGTVPPSPAPGTPVPGTPVPGSPARGIPARQRGVSPLRYSLELVSFKDEEE